MGKKYPAIIQIWERAWAQVIPFIQFAPEIRTQIYTINSIEGLNRAVRKVIKTRTLFPNEEAAKKLIYPENRGIYTQSDSSKKSSRNIWSLAVVSVDQRY